MLQFEPQKRKKKEWEEKAEGWQKTWRRGGGEGRESKAVIF